MIKAIDIKSKAEKKYPSFLSSIVQGQQFDRIVLPCDKKPSENLSVYEQEITDILSGSTERKDYGYHITWQTIHKKSIGKQDIPQEIAFETERDFLKFLRKEKEVAQFKTDVKETLLLFPELQEWMCQYPLKVVQHSNCWTELRKVLSYFKTTPCPHLYIRELPIEIHTKFIEEHEGILKELLDIVIAEYINPEEKKFAKRYHLRDKEPFIRLRCLDTSLSDYYFSGIEELSVPVSQLEHFFQQSAVSSTSLLSSTSPVTLKQVFIVENEINFLTFPKINNSLLLWGHGYDVSNLKNLSILHHVQLYYWGDLDVHGFEILSQFRGYFPHAQSLMMDADTFHTYFEGNEGKPSTLTSELHLYEEEKALYELLKSNNWRLEQEKIPQRYVEEKLLSQK